MKLPTLSKRFWIICSTLLVIGTLFAYYLLVYVEGREKKLRQDKYRALERLGENMIQTRQNYHKAIGVSWLRTRGVIPKLRHQYFEDQKRLRDSNPQKSDLLETRKRLETTGKSIDQLINQDSIRDYSLIREKLKGIRDHIGKTTSDSNNAFWNVYRDTLRKKNTDDVRGFLPKVRYDGYFNKMEYDSLVRQNFSRIYFDYQRPNADKSSVFSLETGDFLAFRPNQFDDFFIVKDFDEHHREKTKADGNTANVVYQTLENHVSLASIDSFRVREKGLLTNHVREIMLSDTKYKLFVHAIRFSERENWLLCGLMETENFNSQIRLVDPLWIVSAILVVLFLIIAMPILKLRIMNTYERLSIGNVWFTGLSVVSGSAVLFIIIWSGSHNLQSIANVDDGLNTLSFQVKARFERELHEIRDQLDNANNNLTDSLITWFKNDSIVYGDFSGRRNNCEYPPFIKNYDASVYPYFNYLLWIDSLGYPSVALTTKRVGPDFKMPNLSERKYVSWALHDSLWYLPSLHGTKPYSPFALQSIQSWTDQRPEAGFGLALDAAHGPYKVLAMATRLHSVMDPVLPLGYGFCIIDESGEVWFHSNTLKNHQENIFSEIKNPDKLTAAVKGRAETHFSTEYGGGRSRMYVQPLGNLPLHLVTFHDKNYQRTPVILTIALAFSMMTILFLIQGVQMLLLFACEFQSGKLITHRFFLKTLRPDPEHSSMYQNGVGAQIVLLIICLALYVRSDFATVFGFITLPVMLVAFHQLLYHKKLKRPVILFLIFSGVTIFLLDVLTFHWLSDEEEQLVMGQQLIFAFVLFLFLPKRLMVKTKRRRTINEVLAQKPEEDAETRDLQKVKSLLDIKGWGQTLTKWFERARKKLKYPNSYYTYLVLWLILISILPVAYFYKMAQWQESLLWAKYEQLQAREATLKRNTLVAEAVSFLPDTSRTYPHTVGSYLPGPDCITSCNTNGDIFQELLFEAWPRLKDPFNSSSAASFTTADDKKWTWTKSMDEVQIEYDSIDGPSPNKVYFTSSYGNFNPFGGDYGFWFFLLTALSFFLLVKMILFSTKYIFGIGIIPQYKMLSDTELKGIIAKSNRVYIAGLPGSGKSELFNQPFQDGIIPNFEMGINDHESNQQKLQDIQARIKDKHDKKIVILSSVQPSAILEVYRKRICDGAHDDDKVDKPDIQKDNKLEDYKIALRKWKNVLGDFEVYYKSIRPIVTKEFTKNEVKNDELNACYYLQRLAQNNKEVLGIDKLKNEDFIINVEEIAEPYYNALWNSFSQEEKLLLFDLAHGGFVNLKNQRCLRILMQKGVISAKDDSLAIMNKSFTNFILSVFREDEELEIAKKARSKGAWQNIQVVLVLTLISIVVFIALAQKELMSDLNAFVVAITGAVGLLSKFGGWLGSGKKE